MAALDDQRRAAGPWVIFDVDNGHETNRVVGPFHSEERAKAYADLMSTSGLGWVVVALEAPPLVEED